ncbi:MAG: response regulator transcription factor [Muribaculaceae bacterium]|nr:response regulator transcription factor [Muribaculaceae bacterium]
MRYAIIENEEFASINLRNLIDSIRPDSRCVFVAESVAESISWFTSHTDIDLVFMDIELDDGSCFDIFKHIDVQAPIIFTTAYDEYAIKAFKQNSIDYILKPVSEEDLLHAVRKFEERMTEKHEWKSIARDLTANQCSRILISSGNRYSFIQMKEIAWFEAEGKYITIVLKDGKSLLSDFSSLVEVMRIVDPNEFYQVSRSVVASVSSIGGVSKFFKGRLHIDISAGSLKRTETVSAERRQNFLNWLGHSPH